MRAVQTQAQLLKMLAHPTRLRLLQALRGGEQCVCHLTALLHQRQAYISQQLMNLRQSGVLEDRKEGARVYYRVRDRRLFELLDAMDALAGTAAHAADPPVVRACSCPRCHAGPPGKKRGALSEGKIVDRVNKLH